VKYHTRTTGDEHVISYILCSCFTVSKLCTLPTVVLKWWTTLKIRE